MSQRPRRSRIAQFKQPFLMGVLGTAALASACGARSEGRACEEGCSEPVAASCPQTLPTAGDVAITCNPPPPTTSPSIGPTAPPTSPSGPPSNPPAPLPPPTPPTVDPSVCPETSPATGDDCSKFTTDLSCHYGDSCGSEWLCSSDATWMDITPSCNPPFPELSSECPPEMPSADRSCAGFEPALNCSYGSDCLREFSCAFDGTWVDESPSCNPPELFEVCPADELSAGDGCGGYSVGTRCMAVDECGGSEVECSIDGYWEEVDPVSCNPPFIEDAGRTPPVEPEADAGPESDAGAATSGTDAPDAG